MTPFLHSTTLINVNVSRIFYLLRRCVEQDKSVTTQQASIHSPNSTKIHFLLLVKTPRGVTATETGFQHGYLLNYSFKAQCGDVMQAGHPPLSTGIEYSRLFRYSGPSQTSVSSGTADRPKHCLLPTVINHYSVSSLYVPQNIFLQSIFKSVHNSQSS